MPDFKIISDNKPAGDQPAAIDALVRGLQGGMKEQTLLGVTGSGKTFTVANVIERIQKPTLVIAHNKTLAAQLTNEFRELFPKNSVNYFVSYYDYYQPEAYLPTSDTYIDKEAMINEEIDRLRHAATTALLTRRDVIVVASVSCIYGLGAPEVYAQNLLHFHIGSEFDRDDLMKKLIELQFNRTTADLKRGTFRLRGDNWEIMPADREIIYNFDLVNGRIGDIFEIDPVAGFIPGETPVVRDVYIAPAKHFITPVPARERAVKAIREELKERLHYFEENRLFLEAERLERRTRYDLAMIEEVGYCHGIENYSRHLSGRRAGEAPDTLLNYFPRKPDGTPDFLTVIDESHVTISQLGGMFEGDASRKRTLIQYGFRLPSAADNRPLRFEELEERVNERIYVSATPGKFETERSKEAAAEARRRGAEVPTGTSGIVEQIIRPTGLIDPKITILPARGQVHDLVGKLKERFAADKKETERVLVTTLTKRMAEDLTEYLKDAGVKVNYIHSDVETLERIKILTALRRGEYDVLVGVNLLREGLDLPEVSLVAILDADKEGFLRSDTSLIQTIGRAARNVRGEVLMYADQVTGSMQRAIEETDRRREKQLEYNKERGITPRTIKKEIKDILPTDEILDLELQAIPSSKTALEKLIRNKEKEMKEAAKELNFELATLLRDEIHALQKKIKELGAPPKTKHKDLPASVVKAQAPQAVREKKSAVKKNLGKTVRVKKG